MPANWKPMDVLARSAGSNKERKVFFHTSDGEPERRQEEAGLCTPARSSPVVYLIVFFSTQLAFQLGRSQHERDWHSVTPPQKQAGLRSRVGYLSQTLTQHMGQLTRNALTPPWVSFILL